jgi:hypothetical protein
MKLIIGYIRSNHDRSMIFVLLCCSEKAILGNHVLVQENVWWAGVYLEPVKPTSIQIHCRFFLYWK